MAHLSQVNLGWGGISFWDRVAWTLKNQNHSLSAVWHPPFANRAKDGAPLLWLVEKGQKAGPAFDALSRIPHRHRTGRCFTMSGAKPAQAPAKWLRRRGRES